MQHKSIGSIAAVIITNGEVNVTTTVVAIPASHTNQKSIFEHCIQTSQILLMRSDQQVAFSVEHTPADLSKLSDLTRQVDPCSYSLMGKG